MTQNLKLVFGRNEYKYTISIGFYPQYNCLVPGYLHRNIREILAQGFHITSNHIIYIILFFKFLECRQGSVCMLRKCQRGNHKFTFLSVVG